MAEVDKLIDIMSNARFFFEGDNGAQVEVSFEAASVAVFTIGEPGEQQFDARFSLTADQLEALAEAARIASAPPSSK